MLITLLKLHITLTMVPVPLLHTHPPTFYCPPCTPDLHTATPESRVTPAVYFRGWRHQDKRCWIASVSAFSSEFVLVLFETESLAQYTIKAYVYKTILPLDNPKHYGPEDDLELLTLLLYLQKVAIIGMC